jgi:hypothetical protein
MRPRVVLALAVIVVAPACDAFGRSADTLSSTPSIASPFAAPSPTALETAADGLPPIVVEAPGADAEVSNPLVVRGTADVYEAVVHVRLTAEADGSLIAGVDSTASCGTGCRGDFRVELHFFVERRQDATLEVFGDDGRDGSPVGIVKVPLTLFP